MERPRRGRILKIGIVLIIASVVLFSLSAYLVKSDTSSSHNIKISPGGTYALREGYVNAGDDIDYTVTSTIAAFNVTTQLSLASGGLFGNETATQKSSLTDVVVSPASGNVTLLIKNTGSQAISIDASVGSIGYPTLLTVIFGFVLLPSGIVLVGINFYSRHVERRKERRLREFR